MNIVKTVEPLITAVMLCCRVDNSAEYFDFVLRTKEQVTKNLNFLQLSEECRQEVSFAITVFMDEIILLKFPNWTLQQLISYSTNKGGEIFFDKLSATEERYNSLKKEEDLALIELYSLLLSLGFLGKFWNDKHQTIEKIRKELNAILHISNEIHLVNNITNIPKFKKLNYIDKTSMVSIILMFLGSLLVALIFNDFAESHQELWHKVSIQISNGEK